MFLSFVVSWFYPCSFCLSFGDAGYPRQFPDQMVVESFLNWVSNGQSTKWKPMKRKLSLKFHCCLVSSIFVYLEWSWTVSKLQGLYVQSTQTYLLLLSKKETEREREELVVLSITRKWFDCCHQVRLGWKWFVGAKRTTSTFFACPCLAKYPSSASNNIQHHACWVIFSSLQLTLINI